MSEANNISFVNLVDYIDRNDTSNVTTAFMIVSSEAGTLNVLVISSNAHSLITSPESTGPLLFDYELPRQTWIHVGSCIDFHTKTVSLYINGELVETKR